MGPVLLIIHVSVEFNRLVDLYCPLVSAPSRACILLAFHLVIEKVS